MATLTETEEANRCPIIRERLAGRVWRTLARLFPWQDCVLCGGDGHGLALCAFCRRALPRQLQAHGTAQRRLPEAFRVPASTGLPMRHLPGSLVVRYRYDFPLDVLITRFKYGGELALAPVLAGLMAPPPLLVQQSVTAALPGRQTAMASPGTQTAMASPGKLAPPACRPWLVPVPSGRVRLQERGFDPTLLLARCYARRFGLRVLPARRLREVPPQAGQGLAARLQGPQGVFMLPPVQGPVLLLDDVLTTGATLAALGRAVARAGATSVGAVVLAQTPAQGR